MINQDKPTTVIGNSAKVSSGETWATVTTTWATETRTWQAISKLISNSLRPSLDFIATEALDYLMTEDNDYLLTGVGAISNQPKPTV